MNKLIDLDLYQSKRSLLNWLTDCKRRFKLKFPSIDFESAHWPIRTLYKSKQPDWYFTQSSACFNSKDKSFCDVVRGLVAEMYIKGTQKIIDRPIRAFYLLAQLEVQSIFEITFNDMRYIELTCLCNAREHPQMALTTYYYLSTLKKQIELLADKGVLPRLGFYLRHEIKNELTTLHKKHNKQKKAEIAMTLDIKIEAFNDALNALYDDDRRLTPVDRVAIALATRLMCAPSRINEVLCSSIDDHVTIEDYVQRPLNNERYALHRAHQMLLISMKGSKGASWSAKPALNFMIDAFNYTTKVIKQLGTRSRMLIEWYQQHPNTLYLPQELENLRGNDLSCRDLAKIVYLTESPAEYDVSRVKSNLFRQLQSKLFEIPNPNRTSQQTRKIITVVPFKDAEDLLVRKVQIAMEACRKVTLHNHYQGDLSKMLVLFDRDEMPYLPTALRDSTINRSLKQHTDSRRTKIVPSLFFRLGITMPVNGKVVVAYIDSHDPRRWLTTQALRYGENLSNVLINKWANRLKLDQLKDYDLRSDEERASCSKMPVVQELVDISNGIKRASKLEDGYGLQTHIVTVPDADICVTSMDLVFASVEDRPVARSSEQIIILYPSQFGVCLHQHHETPCRNYDSCLPCDNDVVVKGHLPSNDKVRRRAELLHASIIRQMDKLVMEHNRGIADDPESLAQHIFTLVEKGLDREQMADFLIDEFHQIKDMVEDKLLVKRLEEAFVARGFVKLLDDGEIPNGALIKYHNPTYHAAPGLEKALDSHGGRQKIQQDEQALIEKYPQFAPKALHLKDERHLLTADDADSED